MPTRRALALIWLVMAGTRAYGHHTLNGVYERSRETTMRGVVTEFRFVNPHPVLIIEVGAEGETETWELEMDNRFELRRIGFTRETLEAGDHVFVKGSVGLIRPRSFYLWRLDRPSDGFWYEQRGTTPHSGFR